MPIVIIKMCAIVMVAATPPLSARKKRMGENSRERVEAPKVWVLPGGGRDFRRRFEGSPPPPVPSPCRWQTAERTSPPIPSAGRACAVCAPASVT